MQDGEKFSLIAPAITKLSATKRASALLLRPYYSTQLARGADYAALQPARAKHCVPDLLIQSCKKQISPQNERPTIALVNITFEQ